MDNKGNLINKYDLVRTLVGVSWIVFLLVYSNGCAKPKEGPQGTTGAQGSPGVNAPTLPNQLFKTVMVVTPCGVASAPYKEVLLFLADCSLLSSFSDNPNGLNTRFTLVPDGIYTDTDASGCVFTVLTSVNTRTVSWGGGSNSYATWTPNSQSCTH